MRPDPPKPTRPDPGLTEKKGGTPPTWPYRTPPPWYKRLLALVKR